MNKFYIIFSLGLLLLFSSCSDIEKKEKTLANDPFKASIVESQFFEISAAEDNVIEGENGTIIVLPKGCFLDGNGNKVAKNVKLELAEALSIEEMILSNLTTTSGGKLLETDGMIFINATSDDKQLKINPENPIYIEIPTDKVKPNMMVYKGIRDELGNMDWITPKPIENNLIPVDIFSLDFLPEGFREEVETGLPFRNFNAPTESAVDSLYYFQKAYRHDISERANNSRNLDNEPYTSNDSLTIDELLYDESETEEDLFPNNPSLDTLITDFGVEPVKIKAIKTETFQNTLLATREFERRLQTIFKICDPNIIDVYINNLDKNMWELDSLVSNIVVNEKHKEAFIAFKKERKTKVKGASINGNLLQSFYQKRLQKIKQERQNIFKQLADVREKEKEKLEKLKREYKMVLQKREKYRMETYGFTQTDLGWVNIDKGVLPKDRETQRLEVLVENGEAYDQLFTYVFYQSISSLYRLNTVDNLNFFVGDESNREMLIPINKPAVIVSIGHIEDEEYLGVLEFETNSSEQLKIALKKTSKKEINEVLKQFETNGNENSVTKDLEYVKKLALSKKEKQKLVDAHNFLRRLETKTYPSMISALTYSKVYRIDMQFEYCDPNPVLVEEVPEQL